MRRDIIVGHSSYTGEWALLIENTPNERDYITFRLDRSDADRLYEELGRQLGKTSLQCELDNAQEENVELRRSIQALRGAVTRATRRRQ